MDLYVGRATVPTVSMVPTECWVAGSKVPFGRWVDIQSVDSCEYFI